MDYIVGNYFLGLENWELDIQIFQAISELLGELNPSESVVFTAYIVFPRYFELLTVEEDLL